MISKSLAKQVINVALSTGADFAELYLETTNSKSFKVENELVENVAASLISGCGIRIILKDRSIYGFTEDISRKSLLKLASNLSASFNEERKIEITNFKTKVAKNINTTEIPFDTVTNEEYIDYLKDISSSIKQIDEHIVRRIVSINYSTTQVYIFNSNSKLLVDNRSIARVSSMVVVNKDGKIETNFSAKGTKAGYEHFTKQFNFKEKALNGAKTALMMVDAAECPSGPMPVIIGNGWGGVLFHEACGHPLEASSVAKNLSCFTGKLNTPIASPIVNAYDDATIPNAWGSSNMDDEGHTPHKTQLIKDGICVNYLIDSFNGRRMNMKENGASRRESYQFEPTSRMSNTYIDNGTSTKEEIISSTKLGLYAVSFNGGQVDPSTGDFNFGVSEAYIVRDGKICEPVRGAMLIGKGHEILFNIDMVANDLDLCDGMCGSSSGSIPVQVGQPTLRIKEILVGGKGGQLK